MASAFEALLLAQVTSLQNTLNTINTGAWVSYNPAWTSSGSAPSVGTGGSVIGFYNKIGRQVTVRAGIYCNTLTNFGSGFYSLSLPFTAQVTSVPSGQGAHAGNWALANNGATFYDVTALIFQNSPTVVNGFVNGSGSFFASNNPAAWTAAAGTWFTCTISYESTT